MAVAFTVENRVNSLTVLLLWTVPLIRSLYGNGCYFMMNNEKLEAVSNSKSPHDHGEYQAAF